MLPPYNEFFKVGVSESGNHDNNIYNNWMNLHVPVKDIEQSTGYNLLSALPQPLRDALENKKFTGGN